MHIAFINPQGNFDPQDSYWTEHPDFGGQLVYVKEVALAMAELGHHVDILTRRILDPQWPEFAAPLDAYTGNSNVRIVRIPFGGNAFLPKEELWPFLGVEFVPGIITFYRQDGRLPDAITAHYGDGGITAGILRQRSGIPFTFTAHSLGAQKMDKLNASLTSLEGLDARFHFTRRIIAERVSMNHASVNVVSTDQERVEQYAHPAYKEAIEVDDKSRFAVIPPGVNLQIFDHRSTNPKESQVQLKIQQMFVRDLMTDRRELPAIVSSSRLDAKKNHVGLVRAFALSQELQQIANLAIVVRGLENPLRDRESARGEERAILDEIVSLLDTYSLWGKVTAFPLSGQDELAAGYRYLAQRGSVFALTALYEPFGLAPLEAIVAGLPGVVTKNGGPSESLYDAQSGQAYGVLVDPADPEDIARGLLRVLASRENWLHYHQAGIQRVYDRYTWHQTAEGYLDVLNSILARRGQEADRPRLPIPSYFEKPTAENDIRVDELARVYFGYSLKGQISPELRNS
jgi:sucrose-phosphate synthase